MDRKKFINALMTSLIGGVLYFFYKYLFRPPSILFLTKNEFSGYPLEIDLREHEAILMQKTNGEFYTLSLECTHKKCKVEWNNIDKEFKCKCHGGRYNQLGEPIGGPPKKRLQIIPTTERQDTIIVGEQKVS